MKHVRIKKSITLCNGKHPLINMNDLTRQTLLDTITTYTARQPNTLQIHKGLSKAIK